MPRNKYPEVTHARILEAATKLFLQNGWEQTTIQDIVDDLGDVSRGAFYHHFQSKDDIIDAVTSQLFGGDYTNLILSVSELETSGLEKLQKLFISAFGNQEQLQFLKTAPSVFKSPISIGKQIKECVEIIAPSICKLIDEGNKDGSMNVKYPKQTSETFMIVMNHWLNPVIYSISKDEYLEKIYHTKLLLEGVGLPFMTDEIMSLFEQYYDAVT